MANKSAFLFCRLNPETKQKLKEKAKEFGLDISDFIRKIAEEEIVILDNNLKRLFSAISLEAKDKCIADSNTKYI